MLGSGSGGNATLLDNGQGCLLVDAGLSAKQLVLRMRELGVEPEDLTGILITHEPVSYTHLTLPTILLV